MTIEKVLREAEWVQKTLSNISESNVLFENAAVQKVEVTIEALIRILFWYDDNQKRLIKGISTLAENNRQLKLMMTENIISNINWMDKHCNKKEKEALKKYLNTKFGGNVK